MFQNLESLLIWIVSIEHIHLAIYIMFLVAILVSERSPETIVAWIFTITVFPVFGFILYLVFGINWRKNRIESLQNKNRRSLFKGFPSLTKYDPTEIFHSRKVKPEDL
ncbi:MAG: PLDc N-terminal domain-containing protein, partial [Leptotrichia sp.]|nr:PLDc N-terminal domain-containing protein [Leptotrichia sp.]